MTHFNGPAALITLDVPTGGVLNVSVEIDLYSAWKEWLIGRYFFNTETDVNGTTERITYVDHSMHTGQGVVYYTDQLSGPENIGLVDGTTYYIRADDASGDRDTFELYDTEANADAGPATTGRMDLTASLGGDGEQHRIAADNSKFLPAFRTIGGDELTPGVEAGPYFFIQNGTLISVPPQGGWRIISTDEDQTANYQGNLVAEDPNTTLINVTPGRSVLHLGLQPVTQRVDELLEISRFAEYAGGVWIDTSSATTGTAYPAGTQSDPVNNLTDATSIANSLGFELFYLRGSITLATGLPDWRIQGFSTDISDIVGFNGQDISGSTFKNISVSGSIPALTTETDFIECRVGAITGTGFQGTMERCGLDDDILLAPGQTNVVGCYSSAAGEAIIDFDFQGNNLIELFIRGYVGLGNITNSSNASSIASIDLISGVMDIDATWLSGIVNMRGTGTYNNNSLLSINDTGLIDQADVLLIKQMTSGNATVSVDDLLVTVYDEDGVTVLATFSLSADGRIRTRLT